MNTVFKEWDRSNLKGSRVQISAISRLPISWVVKRIGDLAKNKKGAIKIGPFGSQLRKEEMVESGVSVFGQENVFNKNFKEGTYFISNEKYEKLKSVQLFAGDIVLTMMGTVGDCCVVPPEIDTGIMDSHLMRIQVNEAVNPYFISRLIRESYIVKKQVECLSQGAIMSGLNLTLVKDIYLPIPPIAEQAKIEGILSAVDDVIEKTDAVIQQTQQLKNGLMQKLFTEGIGHTRFKETKVGRIPEEWEVSNLSALFQVVDGDRGVNYPKSDELLSSGYCVFLNAKNVTKSGFRFDEVQYITQQKDKAMGKGKLTKGDFVLTTRGTLGNFAYFDDTVVFDNLRINSGMVILRPLNNISARFYYTYFNSYYMQKQIERLAYGTAQSQLTVGGIVKFEILVPPPNEQNQIAGILSEIDNNIKSEQSSKAELEQLKKGLMQVLLTGQVRVKV